MEYQNRKKYLQAIEKQLERNIFYHSLALEACMGGVYDYLVVNNQLGPKEPPKDDWLLAGLVHDIDYSAEFKPDHPNKTKEALAKHGLEISESVHNIIKSHSPSLTGRQPQTKADWTILSADSLTGLIVATTLVYPSKKMADVKLSSVLKRFLKEPKFAAGTRREEVKLCAKPDGLNIPLEKFIEICFNSMKSIAPQIGL